MASRYPDGYNEEEWETESMSENEFCSETESNRGKCNKIICIICATFHSFIMALWTLKEMLWE